MRTPHSKPTITVQLEREQYNRLVALAEADDRTLGYVVRKAIAAYLESQAPAYDPAYPHVTLRPGSPVPPKPGEGGSD
jgi:uncharacterized protein YfaQ (DUF2300 family)